MIGTAYESQGKKDLVKTTKTYNGFNYVLVESIFTFTMTGNKKITSSHFECNCSAFKAEQDVINFIDEIA